MEKTCKFCKLYDNSKKLCNVNILHNGEKIKLNMEENDKCIFLEFEIADNIKQIRTWVENENGEKCENGIVKIEFPED